jgi:hypothetical protein
VFIAEAPAQAFQGTFPRFFDWNTGAFEAWAPSSTEVSARSNLSGNALVTGLASGGARRIAVLYIPGAATRLSVNGSAVVVGGDTGIAVPTAPIFIANRAGLDRALNGSLGIFAAYPGNPSDAQLQAMSAL